MPRKARIDAPGALHHVMARGIERRIIFLRISVPTASVAANKGEQIALEFGYSLMDLLNIKK
jgi:hypothetical protein